MKEAEEGVSTIRGEERKWRQEKRGKGENRRKVEEKKSKGK